MDGIMMDRLPVQVVGEVDLDAGPAPFCTTAAMVHQIMGQRGKPYDPIAAQDAAEKLLARRMAVSDKLIALREQRRLTAPEMAAAGEIGLMIEWIEGMGAAPPVARTQFRERLAGSTGPDAANSWLWKLEIEHTRYAPWREWACAFPLRRRSAHGQTRTLETLTRAFVIERLGVRSVADRMGLDQRRAEALLRRSLHRYAFLAGRQTGDNPPAIDR